MNYVNASVRLKFTGWAKMLNAFVYTFKVKTTFVFIYSAISVFRNFYACLVRFRRNVLFAQQHLALSSPSSIRALTIRSILKLETVHYGVIR